MAAGLKPSAARCDGRGSVTVIGAGWAGLAAAVALVQTGAAVTLHEMGPLAGGRARSVRHGDEVGDNGQHILIGAYQSTLGLMRQIGVDPGKVLLRTPLALRDTQGQGLELPAGPAVWAFPRAVLALRAWSLGDRLALLRRCTGWAWSRFDCDPSLNVDGLCAGLPTAVREELIDPLCVAALNTQAHEASAQVFLRVLRDALLGGRGSADLLLPRVPLGAVLPDAAARWLQAHDARVHMRSRVTSLRRVGARWSVDDSACDQVVLACSATEAARLALPHAPVWSAQATALRHQAILTTYVQADGARLPEHPMVRLSGGPAQFAFDHGRLTGRAGRFAFVASAVDPWMARGLAGAEEAVMAQAVPLLRAAGAHASPRIVRSVCERRATFACITGLQRPAARVAPGLWAAGDYVEGPYPATLEGAVRSGQAAAALCAA
jgi:squalene-associated FAD-dependent desaturase